MAYGNVEKDDLMEQIVCKCAGVGKMARPHEGENFRRYTHRNKIGESVIKVRNSCSIRSWMMMEARERNRLRKLMLEKLTIDSCGAEMCLTESGARKTKPRLCCA